MTEKEFLQTYDSSKYEKPSVTVDILIFTINQDMELELLLIKRGAHPFKDKWALPGGFVNMKESLDEAARRELREETGADGEFHLEQLYTFGTVDRDPRMRVISVAYMALVPKTSIKLKAGDDAAEAEFFQAAVHNWEVTFRSQSGKVISMEDMAFDHAEIIRTGLKRLAGKLDYTDIAFELLEDKNNFTIGELQKIYECIKGQTLNTGNFWKSFKKKYVDEKIVIETEHLSQRFSKKPSKCYRYIR